MDPNIWYPALSVLTLIAMGGQYAISGLAFEGPHKGNEVFRHTESEQWNKYETVVSPYHWAHRIWFFIYAWQALWILYAVIQLCRRDSYRRPRYANPVIFHPALFILTIGHFGCHIAWQLLMDRNHVLASFIVLAVNLLFLISSLCFSYYTLSKAEIVLRAQKRVYDLWLVRIFLHNSLGLQIGWAAVVTFLHMAKFMMYEAETEVDGDISGSAALGAILAFCLIYSIVDLIAMNRFSRYTITTNVPVVYAVAIMLHKHSEIHDRNFIIAIVTIIVASLFFLMKTAVTIYRHVKEPQLPVEPEDDQSAQQRNIYETMDYTGKRYLLY